MAGYPASIPTFKRLPMELTIGADNLARTNMDVGPAKVRRRTSTRTDTIAGTTPVMTALQYTEFRTFYHDTLADGALEFTGAHPVTCETVTMRFVDGYQVSPSGAKFTVRATLEVIY